MSEENRQTPNAYFLTLTIDDKSYKQIKQKYNLKDDNDIATKAIRLCLERVRKLTKKSVKHWFITDFLVDIVTGKQIGRASCRERV